MKTRTAVSRPPRPSIRFAFCPSRLDHFIQRTTTMKRSFLALLMILIATTTAGAATTKKRARKQSKKAPVVQPLEAESQAIPATNIPKEWKQAGPGEGVTKPGP